MTVTLSLAGDCRKHCLPRLSVTAWSLHDGNVDEIMGIRP